MNIDKEKLKALAEAAQNASGDYAALNDYGMAVPPAVTLALLAEIEVLRENANFRAVQSLRADCEALRKDAERYRWLRDPDNQCAVEDDSNHYMPPMICGYAEHEDILTREALDKAIDAALAQEVQP
ncbi:hypothetical protein [Pseudomonas sp. 910_21]|uniref:hypothetical protein n=1 Tax=Pseudomonas sp. 910_21 TaxID=2604460 RepID=UPI0040638441